jgi:hypothetical protein
MYHSFLLNILYRDQWETVIGIGDEKTKNRQFQIVCNILFCLFELDINNILSCALFEETRYILALFNQSCQKKMGASYVLAKSEIVEIFTEFWLSIKQQIYLYLS